MRGGDEILAMAGNPLHRTAEAAGGPQNQHVFRIEAVLDPEPTADIRAGDLDPFRRNPEHGVGQWLANAMHTLAGQQQVENLCRGIVIADGGTVFKRGDDQPIVDQLELDDMRCAGKGSLHGGLIALLEPEGDIPRNIVPQLRRTRRHGLKRIDDAGQGGVSDVHAFDGVDRGCTAFGHDERHGLADIAHAIGGQGKMVGNAHRFDGRDLRGAGQRTDPVGVQIPGAEYAEHARDRACCRRVDPFDRRMRVRRADDLDEELAGTVDVVGKAAFAGEKTLILQTPDRLAAQLVHLGYPMLARRLSWHRSAIPGAIAIASFPAACGGPKSAP